MKYYYDIKNKLIDNEVYAKVKDYSKERHRVETYYEVGKMLSKAGKHYGENIIGKYAEKLTNELGKKYSYRTLKYMYNFYEFQKVQSVTANLSWGHWIELLSLKDVNEIKYYINLCESLNLTTRELREKIKNKEYERLPNNTKQNEIKKDNIDLVDYLKEPIIIKNNNQKIINEKVLHKLILENIESFMQELGIGFCFIGSEYKIKLNDTYNYIDLLLFNIDFNCYVVIELKSVPLKKEHIGQIEFYMDYIDKNLKKLYQGKTIGIIITKKNNKYLIEYASDKRILARTYQIK